MPVSERLAEQMKFIAEMDRLKGVFRQSYITDGTRRENDAEHSWHLAVMVVLLREYASEPRLDVLLAVKMALAHDMVEIITGDTFVYDSASRAAAAEKERVAAEEIFAALPEPDGHGLLAIWKEYEEGSSPEALYVRALDRVEPIMLNYLSGGMTWREHGITLEAVRRLNVPIVTAGAPRLAEYVEELLSAAAREGVLQ